MWLVSCRPVRVNRPSGWLGCDVGFACSDDWLRRRYFGRRKHSMSYKIHIRHVHSIELKILFRWSFLNDSMIRAHTFSTQECAKRPRWLSCIVDVRPSNWIYCTHVARTYGQNVFELLSGPYLVLFALPANYCAHPLFSKPTCGIWTFSKIYLH